MNKQRRNAETAASGDEYDSTDSFSSYREYNKVLRTWFVAFGVGGPTLLLINEKVADRLAEAGTLRSVAILFLLGAATQVLVAFANKVANWYVYVATIEAGFRGTCRHRLSEWTIRQFWIDILFDFVTIGCFGSAALKMLCVFACRG